MNRHKRTVLLGGAAAILLCGGAAAFWLYRPGSANHCDFSQAVRKNVDGVALYCPNPLKLPKGVISHVNTASMDNGAIVYSLKDGSKSLAVSLQEKPSKEKLDNFVPNLIPLHFDIDTPIGKAQTGVSKGQSLTSLPTNSSTWLIITAPADYDPDRLSEILKSFQAD